MRHGKFDDLVIAIKAQRSQYVDVSQEAWASVIDGAIESGFVRLMKGATGAKPSQDIFVLSQARSLCTEIMKVEDMLSATTAADAGILRTAFSSCNLLV
jgi:hypothetical protein